VEREAAVLGSEDDSGLELYDRRGSVAGLAAALDGGRISGRERSLTCVTFELEPAWAVEAVQAAYGLPVFPNVVRLRRGRPRAPERLELLQLAAALEVVALAGSDERAGEMDAKVAICTGGYEIVAVSRRPDSINGGAGSRSSPGQAAA
jgi:hypothetical protein